MSGGSAIRAVRGGARYLGDVVAGLLNGIRRVAPLVLALSCESTKVEPPRPAPAVSTVQVTPIAENPVTDSDEPRQLGTFNMTFYYVAGEADAMKKLANKSAANSNQSANLATVAPAGSGETITLYSYPRTKDGKVCKPVAEITKGYAASLALQGTGKLKDGRVVNIQGQCPCGHSPCFKVTSTKWGTGGNGQPLQPFRTVAVDPSLIKLGSLLYIPQLEGRTMPGRSPWGGFVHDGCVVAGDTGGGIKGNQLDMFVARKGYVDALAQRGGSHKWARGIPVFDGSKVCERKGRKVSRKTADI